MLRYKHVWLDAHRGYEDEPHRLIRVKTVVEQIEFNACDLFEKLVSICDHKGTFMFVWCEPMDATSRYRTNEIVAEATYECLFEHSVLMTEQYGRFKTLNNLWLEENYPPC